MWDMIKNALGGDNWLSGLGGLAGTGFSIWSALQNMDMSKEQQERLWSVMDKQMGMYDQQMEMWKSYGRPLEEKKAGYMLGTGGQPGIIDKQYGLMSDQLGYQQKLLPQYFENTQKQLGLESDYFDQAKEGFNVNEEVGKATADIGMAFKGAQGQMDRDAARRGINPNSGSFASSMTGLARDKALATAGARTQTARDTNLTNMNLKQSAVSLAKGMPVQTPSVQGYAGMPGMDFTGGANIYGNMASAYSSAAGDALKGGGYFWQGLRNPKGY